MDNVIDNFFTTLHSVEEERYHLVFSDMIFACYQMNRDYALQLEGFLAESWENALLWWEDIGLEAADDDIELTVAYRMRHHFVFNADQDLLAFLLPLLKREIIRVNDADIRRLPRKSNRSTGRNKV